MFRLCYFFVFVHVLVFTNEVSADNKRLNSALGKVGGLFKHTQKLAKIFSDLQKELQKIKEKAEKLSKTAMSITDSQITLAQTTPVETKGVKIKTKKTRRPYKLQVYIANAMKSYSCNRRRCVNSVKRNISSLDGSLLISDSKNDRSVICGNKQYFRSFEPFEAKSTAAYCCSLGMEEAAFSSLEEMKCVIKGFKRMKGPQSLYVSYFDMKVDGNFTSCRTGAKIDGLWCKGQPDNLLENETCVTFKINEGLLDNTCIYGYKLPVLCQYEMMSTSTQPTT